ncbi:hypothetical protein BSLG_005776 [Batrachochytrium salamandrivorans]|nr:hypothetical protein BSLG_005776 [Batrachochytrium salamandrivorans]
MLSCLPFFSKTLEGHQACCSCRKNDCCTGTPDASKELVCIMDDFMELFCQSAPEYSPIFGLDRYPDEIFNSSKEFHEKNIGIVTKLLNELKQSMPVSSLSRKRTTLNRSKEVVLKFFSATLAMDMKIPATHMYGAFASFHYPYLLSSLSKPSRMLKTMLLVSKELLNDLEKFVAIDLPEDYAIAAIRDYLVPAYTSVKVFLESEYLPHARSTAGIYSLADSQRVYNDLIYLNTTVRYTADELHQLGLKEVSRILCPHGGNKEQSRIDKKMPELFSKFPKFECDVKSVPPAAESSSPIAFYQPGTAEKDRYFSTNLLLSKDSPRHSAMALTLHEANPGHHHQVSLALEMPVSHTFLKTVSNTAYVEGWELEMFRALRLVVDTGLHTLGWTVDKCVETMSEQLSMSHKEIVSEVRRYSIMPGQALAYKVGEIKIREVRSYAETALGSKFDIRAFTMLFLITDLFVLKLLELNVKEWVQCILPSVLLRPLM